MEFVQKKSNEIPAIPKLLDQLEIQGHVISVDAMGTQTSIAKKIKAKEADCLMALKSNQGSLHEKVEKANGRVCTRRVAVTNQLDWMLQSIQQTLARFERLSYGRVR